MIPNYDGIPLAETAETYLDTALRRAAKQAGMVKKIKDRVLLKKAKEKDRLRTINETLRRSLGKLHDSYPSFDQLSEFSLRVFSLDMDPGVAKQALGGIQHAIITVQGLVREHIQAIHSADDEKRVLYLRKACIGRIASVMRQTAKHLRTLNEARAVFRGMPCVDESLFTVAIAGFPNVGKSTFLSKLTGASPQIQSYAFTTKGLNVGYFEYRYNKVQCIDTPGTLNRDEMNAIERKADITIRYLATCIVYVFDPTEGSYPLSDQRKLYQTLKQLDKDVVVYISKTDIASPEQTRVLVEEFDACTTAKQVAERLGIVFKEWI